MLQANGGIPFMKYVDDCRDQAVAAALAERVKRSDLAVDHQSVRTCLYCRMRVSLVSTVAFSSLAVATMI